MLGVPPGQVTGDALVEPELVEQAEGRGDPLFMWVRSSSGEESSGEVVGTVGPTFARSRCGCAIRLYDAAPRPQRPQRPQLGSGSSSTRGVRSRTTLAAVDVEAGHGSWSVAGAPACAIAAHAADVRDPAGGVVVEPAEQHVYAAPIEVVEHEGHLDGVAGAEDAPMAVEAGRTGTSPPRRCAPPGPRRAGRRVAGRQFGHGRASSPSESALGKGPAVGVDGCRGPFGPDEPVRPCAAAVSSRAPAMRAWTWKRFHSSAVVPATRGTPAARPARTAASGGAAGRRPRRRAGT